MKNENKNKNKLTIALITLTSLLFSCSANPTRKVIIITTVSERCPNNYTMHQDRLCYLNKTKTPTYTTVKATSKKQPKKAKTKLKIDCTYILSHINTCSN